MPHRRHSPQAILVLAVALLLAACGDPSPAPTSTPIPPTAPPDVYARIASTTALPFPTPTARPAETPERLLGRAVGPYPAPSTCAVSPVSDHERRRTFPAFWLDGNDLWAGNPLGTYYAGENKVQWQPRQMGPYNDNDAITFTGTRLDAAAPPAELRSSASIGTGYSSLVFFPTPGCWRIRGAVGAQSLDATVFVFEESCFPGGGRSTTPSGGLSGSCPAPPAAPTPTAQAVAGACPVTQPPNPPLVPPPLSPPEDVGTVAFWYGNDALLLSLMKDGTMLQGDKRYIRRLVTGQLTVEGRRLDAPAPPLDASLPDGYGESLGGQATGFNFPTTGCWEIAARVSGRELRFVVNVVPRPALPATVPPLAAVSVTPDAAVNWEQMRRPWQMPPLAPGDACPVTPRREVAPRVFAPGGGRGPVYAIGYGDVTLGAGAASPALLKTLWVAHASYAGPVLIRGRQLDGPGTLAFQRGVPGIPEPEMRLNRSGASSSNAEEWRQWPSLTVAPGPGCYAFQVDGDAFTDTVVFRVAP